jgi:hypothetical protein
MKLSIISENGEDVYTTNEPHCIPRLNENVFFENRLFIVVGIVHEILPLNVYSLNIHVKEIFK